LRSWRLRSWRLQAVSSACCGGGGGWSKGLERGRLYPRQLNLLHLLPAGDLPRHAVARDGQPGRAADRRAARQCGGLCVRVAAHEHREGEPALSAEHGRSQRESESEWFLEGADVASRAVACTAAALRGMRCIECQQSCLLPHLLNRVPGGACGTWQQWQACPAAELAASGSGGERHYRRR